MSSHGLLREWLVAAVRAQGHQVIETDTHTLPRGTPISTVVIDLDHANEDSQTLVLHVRNQLRDQGSFVIVIGSPMRIAAAADDFADVELESARADAAALRAALSKKPRPRSSAELARAHRLWAEVTPRQRDVLRWLAGGHDNPTIADHLDVGERAIKAHISVLLELFGVDNRTKLAVLVREAGLRPPTVR
jgi:DNA-binding NarL/FixJ family response regulator